MDPFIRVTEIWVPSLDETELIWKGGLYGPLSEFKTASEYARFKFDEGLPGKAWACRHPIVLAEFENSYFKRTALAKAVGLTCGVALPVFSGETLKAIIVLLCGTEKEHSGAIELWSCDRAKDSSIRLSEGYFGSADVLEWTPDHIAFKQGFGPPGISWPTRFDRGDGLAGSVLKTGMPQCTSDAFKTCRIPQSIRQTGTDIGAGLGVPWFTDPIQHWVVTFLTSARTPIARRFEIWMPNAEGDALVFGSSAGQGDAGTSDGYNRLTIAIGEGTLGRVLETKTPSVLQTTSDEPAQLKKLLDRAGLQSGLAMPIINRDGAVVAVSAWYS